MSMVPPWLAIIISNYRSNYPNSRVCRGGGSDQPGSSGPAYSLVEVNKNF